MNSSEKAQYDWEVFFTKLLGAIALAGGCPGEHWKSKTIEEVHKILRPNGIILAGGEGDHWKRMTLEEVYKTLHLSGLSEVRLKFRLTKDLRERTFG